jgi:hypothetical protein
MEVLMQNIAVIVAVVLAVLFVLALINGNVSFG